MAANDANTTGLFQTLVLPARAQLQAPSAFKNSMLEKIYIQQQPIPGTVGQVINVNIPTVTDYDVVDIGSGPIHISDEDHTTVAISINNNQSKARKIADFNQVRTPVDLLTFYLQPLVESVTRKIDRAVCNLINSTQFATYTTVTGGDDVFTRVNLGDAWANLVGAGAPMTPGDVHFVTHHVPYSKMLGDATQNFIQQYVVGEEAAVAAQRTARMMPQFQASIDYDQLVPKPTSTSYSGLFFHRMAIAVIPVVPPTQNKPGVDETFYTVTTGDGRPTGLTYRIQFWYDPREQGWILHVHCVFGMAVVRSQFGSYMVTT